MTSSDDRGCNLRSVRTKLLYHGHFRTLHRVAGNLCKDIENKRRLQLGAGLLWSVFVLLLLRLDVAAVAHCCLLLFSFAAFLFAFNDNATALCICHRRTAPSSGSWLIPLAKRPPDTLPSRPPFVIRSTTIMVGGAGQHQAEFRGSPQRRMPHCQCIKC